AKVCVGFSAMVLGLGLAASGLVAQRGQAPPLTGWTAASGLPAPKTWTTAEDHRHKLTRLRITDLRPGPSGHGSAPNAANTDESKANPYPNLPDVLTLKNGQRVTTDDDWWKQRRPEIVEDFEREIYGRVPANVPRVDWKVAERMDGTVAGRAVVGKQ